MRIIGIDPGLATVGIGLIEANCAHDLRVVDYLTIETASKTVFAQRLKEIGKDLDDILTDFQPELAIIEKLYFSVNEKTALDVAQARGVILSCVAGKDLEIIEPTPPELKSCITGDGSADKKQMQQMVKMIFNLKEIPQPDDAADALALAAFGAFQGKRATLIA
ncbi:crossover junction endodeoxyribonuclease RuvC [bacterium]|nr:crossover junction endodeoxyribonuclease RuvC [bacterium]|tara:strand:- start:35366 stop:35857 length:492 start_codon:yes stop_codon:yes gene_type:complete